MTIQPKTELKPIVILHGWGSSPERWKPIHKALEAHTPFLPGFDEKNPLKRPFSVEDYALWLDMYLDSHNIKNPILVGHSNGGRIAIHYAAHYENISKLVLIASAGIPDPSKDFKKAVFKALAKSGKKALKLVNNEKLAGFFQKILYKAARESDYVNAAPIMKKTMENILKYDAREDLGNIPVPALLIWGQADTATPVWMGHTMKKMIRASQIKILPAKHNVHITHNKEVIQLINDFVS